MSLFSGSATYIPVIRSFGTTGYRDIFSWLRFQILTFIPINSYILDKLEGIHETLIIFRNISGHLQWTVHSYIQCQLAGDSRANLRVISRIHFVAMCFEDPRSIIHRSSNQTGEWKNCSMVYFVAAE